MGNLSHPSAVAPYYQAPPSTPVRTYARVRQASDVSSIAGSIGQQHQGLPPEASCYLGPSAVTPLHHHPQYQHQQ